MMRIFALILIIISFPFLAMCSKGYFPDSNLHVQGDNWEIKAKGNSTIIQEDVTVKADDFTIKCDKLVVTFEKKAKGDGNNYSAKQIKKLTATGHVEIIMKNGDVTLSGKAEYFKKDKRVILTDNPIAIFGKNKVKGCKKIIYNLQDETYQVIMCEEQKAAGTVQ